MYNSSEEPSSAKQQLHYFLPQQMLLLVEHKEPITPAQLESLVRASDQLLGKARLVPRRVLTFSQREPLPGQPATFSLIFTTVTGIGSDPNALVPLVIRLDEHLRQETVPGLTLHLASPNWLLSGAPGHIGTGGPGAVPVSDLSIAAAGANSFLAPDAPWGWKLPDRLSPKLPPEQRGAGVDVAILDTAPCVHDLVHAYDIWHATHPLIDSLLRPRGRLHVQNAGYADLARLASYQLRDHRYVMADHGLFVAGIIHTLAPQANLHLIEVLNPYGVGDLESIALGLWRLTRRRSARPLLINCSLVVNIPLEGHPQQDMDPQLLRDAETIRRMGFPLEWICNLLSAQRIQVVAAAGNDSHPDSRLPARYPAAFNSVVGVGALQKDDQPAPYTNLSDTPVPNSIATFGGTAQNGLAIAAESVLGIFTNDFPGAPGATTTSNTNGWAWWSGTSFATPVITGTLAVLMSEGMSTGDAVTAIQNADTTHAATNVGEGVFDAHQGT